MSKRMLVCLFCILPLLTSCKKKINNKSSNKYANLMNNSLLLYEAKYLDLPTPVGYSLDTTKRSDQLKGTPTHSLQYQGSLSVKDATSFYLDSLERLGWNILDLSSEHEGLLFCRKLEKSCAVSIRSEGRGRKSKVCIFLQNDIKNISNKIEDINSKKLIFT